MKAILTQDETLLYGSMEDQSISIATLHKGEIVDLGKVIRKRKKVWVEATTPLDLKGYVDGETKIFTIRKGRLSSNTADLVETPSASGRVIKTYTKGAVMELSGIEKNEEGDWFAVTDDSGAHGYINAKTKLRQIQEPTRSGAIRNIVYGLVFIAMGILFTFMNQKNNANSSLVYVSIAVVFFGLLQGGQGVTEYLRWKKSKNSDKK